MAVSEDPGIEAFVVGFPIFGFDKMLWKSEITDSFHVALKYAPLSSEPVSGIARAPGIGDNRGPKLFCPVWRLAITNGDVF